MECHLVSANEPFTRRAFEERILRILDSSKTAPPPGKPDKTFTHSILREIGRDAQEHFKQSLQKESVEKFDTQIRTVARTVSFLSRRNGLCNHQQ